MNQTPKKTVRVGAASYLNTKPLLDGLDGNGDDYELTFDYPSRLAQQLAQEQLDVALIPVIEAMRLDCEIVTDVCVASRGPARSVMLYSRVPMAEIRRLALDEGSRSSAAMTRILLSERVGVEPQVEPLPLEDSITATSADAILVIGDRALHRPAEQFVDTWDVGEEWSNWTGFPFVYSMWTARKGIPLGTVDQTLRDARDRGVKKLESIALSEAPQLGLPDEVAVEYLTQRLYYRLEEAERRGLERFRDLAVKHGLVPEGADLAFRD